MKIYCLSWKDERWSADKEALKAINKMVSKEKKKESFSQSAISSIFYVLGWIFFGICSFSSWIFKKIKRK